MAMTEAEQAIQWMRGNRIGKCGLRNRANDSHPCDPGPTQRSMTGEYHCSKHFTPHPANPTCDYIATINGPCDICVNCKRCGRCWTPTAMLEGKCRECRNEAHMLRKLRTAKRTTDRLETAHGWSEAQTQRFYIQPRIV